MTLTKIASFLTSPVDVVTKTPNDFIRNSSIPTAAKVAAVAVSAILLIASLSITHFVGKALISKAQVQAPQVARPLFPSIAPALEAPQAPINDILGLGFLPFELFGHRLPRIWEVGDPTLKKAAMQLMLESFKRCVNELRRKGKICTKVLKPTSEIDQNALKEALNQFITQVNSKAKTVYLNENLLDALSLLQVITIKEVLTVDDIENIDTLSQYASLWSCGNVSIDTARLDSLIAQRLSIAAQKSEDFTPVEHINIYQLALRVIKQVSHLCKGNKTRLATLEDFNNAIKELEHNPKKAKWNQAVQPMIGWFGRKFEGKPNPFAVLKTSHSLGRSA